MPSEGFRKTISCWPRRSKACPADEPRGQDIWRGGGGMMPALFLAFCLAWFTILAFILHRALPRRAATLSLGGLALWLLYAGVLAYNGWLARPDPPPALPLLLLPLIAFAIWLSRSSAPLALVRALPLRALVGLQVFRVGVEIFLDRLWRAGLLPEGMTWHGHNFDILTGLSAFALFLAWNRIPNVLGVAKAWNVLGLVLLAQVAVTGVLSAPGPQQILNRSTPNVAIVTFPYVLVAALFVLSALALHILALRKIAAERRTSPAAA
jgi:hypothetical protein